MTELHILLLPPELTVKVFANLNLQALLNCTRVCRHFKALIAGSSLLRYHISLEACGMENGPGSPLTTDERRQKLRAYSEAWRQLQWTEHTTIPLGTWGKVFGLMIQNGILAYARDNQILLTRLPSLLRGIERHDWQYPVESYPRECAIDPSQDLLVLMSNTQMSDPAMWSIRLLSLTTGEAHPLAAPSPDLASSHLPQGFEVYSIELRVFKNHMGILFEGAMDSDHRLVIHDWQTGLIELIIPGDHISRFIFLSETSVLVAASRSSSKPVASSDTVEPSLLIFHMDQIPIHRDASVVLYLPALVSRTNVDNMVMHSNPSPHSPSSALRTPFGLAHDHRLILLSYTAESPSTIQAITHFIPYSAIAPYATLPPSGSHAGMTHVLWEDWGEKPARTRIEQGNVVADSPSSGMRFILPAHLDQTGNWHVRIWDFNPFWRQKLEQLQLRQQADDASERVVDDDDARFEAGLFTNETLEANLPYVLSEIVIPPEIALQNPIFAISEDAIVAISHSKGSSGAEAHVLSF